LSAIVKNIWIKGLWHQGLVGAGVWAERGFKVTAICDTDDEAEALANSDLPLFEPGLNDLISKQVSNGNLIFTVLSSDLTPPDVLAFMHDTEVNEDDEVQLDKFLEDVQILTSFITPSMNVFITAQVPAGTCSQIQKSLSEVLGFSPLISYMPENLRLGQAISRFKSPELPVIGVSQLESKDNLRQLFSDDVSLRFCLILEAEILKSALNTFLSVAITFGNEVSEICDRLEVSGNVVMSLLKLEPRIGSGLPLMPGLPFSGGTLGRDVQNLRKLASGHGPIINAIWSSNLHRKDYFVESVASFAKSVNQKSIGLLGLTYKTGTSTLRRSFPLQCAQSLDQMGFTIFGFDPMSDSFDGEIGASVNLCPSISEIFSVCEVLVITTPWDEIISSLSADLLRNKTIIDPYGVVPKDLIEICYYYQFGGRT
jgi:UDPglucose 6-dehydrogenase